MEIYEKRGRWCVRYDNGKLKKFNTEEEAKLAAGWVPPLEEIDDAEEEGEEKDCEEETSTDQQEALCVGESDDEEEV